VLLVSFWFLNSNANFPLLCHQLQVLNKHSWPMDVTTTWSDGEQRLAKLCRRLHVDFNKTQRGFRDFVDNGGTRVPDDMMELNFAVDTIPVTSADAERGFSAMNMMCTPLRNRLGVERLSTLIFVKLVGPSLQDFNPLPYVKKWLAMGHRGAFENKSRKCEHREEPRYNHMRKIFE